jgi:hypothetical protein
VASQPACELRNASKKTMSVERANRVFVFAAVAAFCMASFGSAPIAGQSPTGPQTPPKQPDIVRVPNRPGAATDQPSIPPEEIVRRFAAQEDQLARLFTSYVYRKTIRVEEIGADGKPSGQAELTTAPVVTSEGVRSQRPTGEPDSSLKILNLGRDDVDALSKMPVFPLVSSNLPKYELTYQGKQPLDELMTYVFQVTPRQLERERAYFRGLVWVDDHDLTIVKSYGKWVTETGDVRADAQLPFTLFETYRQPVANKYWLPAYSRSDSTADNKGASVPVRLIIRWDNYTPVPAEKTSEISPPPAPQSPAR